MEKNMNFQKKGLDNISASRINLITRKGEKKRNN